MTEAFGHLTEGTRAVLAQAPEARIQWFAGDRWVGYDLANNILKRMEDIRLQTKAARLAQTRADRLPNLLIAGATSNGKSSLIRRFKETHPPVETEAGTTFPVLAVEFPPTPDELRFYNRVLETLNIPFNPNDSVRKREPQIHALLPSLGLEVLLIDEIHNILAGHPTKQRQFLNALRSLSNRLNISIVCAGTREAARGLSADPQMANRFPPMPLPLWVPDKDWRRLIASFERLLPLPEPSLLGAPRTALFLHERAEGRIGELKTFLLLALREALARDKPRIDADVLKAVDFVPPSKRRAHAEALG